MMDASNSLREIQTLIDKHAGEDVHIIEEGDYLQICNHMRTVFQSKVSSTPNVFQQPISIQNIPGLNEDAINYFYNNHKCNRLWSEIRCKEHEIKGLVDEETYYFKERKRRVIGFKNEVVQHFCALHRIRLEDWTYDYLRKHYEENGSEQEIANFEKMFGELCETYMTLENSFVRKHLTEIMARKEELYDKIDELETEMAMLDPRVVGATENLLIRYEDEDEDEGSLNSPIQYTINDNTLPENTRYAETFINTPDVVAELSLDDDDDNNTNVNTVSEQYGDTTDPLWRNGIQLDHIPDID